MRSEGSVTEGCAKFCCFGARKGKLFGHSKLRSLASSGLKTSFLLLVVFASHSSSFLWAVGSLKLLELD